MSVQYLLLVCSDGVASDEKAAANRDGLPSWLEEMERRGARVYGERLQAATEARTVRVRDGHTLVSDGPFAETKEFIAGFDIIGCADLDEAIAIAAAHPVASFHAIEVRPFARAPAYRGSDAEADPHELRRTLERPIPPSAQRYLVMPCADGIAGTDAEEASIRSRGERWRSDLDERGVAVYGHPLAPSDAATTVRVRDGRTMLTDGPFAETKEFIAGFDIIDCADLDEAVRIASGHPLAHFHRCEVRPFWHGS
jgi:hypothetical protein